MSKSLKWIEGSQSANEKLFDEVREDINEKYKIRNGQIEDQTTILCETNINQNSGPIFG